MFYLNLLIGEVFLVEIRKDLCRSVNQVIHRISAGRVIDPREHKVTFPRKISNISAISPMCLCFRYVIHKY